MQNIQRMRFRNKDFEIFDGIMKFDVLLNIYNNNNKTNIYYVKS